MLILYVSMHVCSICYINCWNTFVHVGSVHFVAVNSMLNWWRINKLKSKMTHHCPKIYNKFFSILSFKIVVLTYYSYNIVDNIKVKHL